MKYAFIALIAIYLVIYGCSPDSSEKAKDSHEQTATTAVEDSQKSEETVAPAVQHESADAIKQQEKVVAVDAAKQAPAVIEEKVGAEEQPAEKEHQQEVAESEQVELPCGRIVARADIPEQAPCLRMQPQDTAAAVDSGNEQELTAALQKMVDTTNDMVLATRQLVIATQELLDANKKADEETPPAQQGTEGQVPAQQ